MAPKASDDRASSRAAPGIAILLVMLVPGLSGSAPAGAAPEDAPPRWSFARGDAFRYRVRSTSTTESVVEGEPDNFGHQKLGLDFDLSCLVREVAPDGTARVALTVDRVREEGWEAGRERAALVYDSADARTVANAWSALKQVLYRPLLGRPYDARIDPRGVIVAVGLPEGALRGWDEARLRPEEARDPLFTEAGARALLGAWPALPDATPTPATPWRARRVEDAGTVRATVVDDYTPTPAPGGGLAFDIRPSISYQVLPGDPRDLPGTARGRRPASVTVEAQEGGGQLRFDPALGRPTRFARDLRWEIRTVYGATDGAEGMIVRGKFARAIEIDLLPTGPK